MRSMLVLALVLASPAYAQDAAAPAAPAAEDAAAAEPPPADPGRPAEKGTIGIGLVLGEPSGVTAKIYLQDDQAIQIALGSSFYADAWQANAEYLWHPWILQDRDTLVLASYLGPGVRAMRYNEGRAGDDAHFAMGVRAVIGLLFDFKEVPLDVFLEAGGVVEYDFTEGFGPGFNIGAGVRYYF